MAGEQPPVPRLRAVIAAKDEYVTVLQAQLGAALTRLDAAVSGGWWCPGRGSGGWNCGLRACPDRYLIVPVGWRRGLTATYVITVGGDTRVELLPGARS